MRAWAAGCRLKGRSGVMRGAPQPRARVQSTCGDGRRISIALDAYRGTRVRRCAPRLQHVVAEVAAELQRGVEGRFRRRLVLRRPTARQRCTALRNARAAMQARMGTRRQLCRQQRGVEALIRLQGAKGGSTGGTASAAVSAQHAAHTALEMFSAAHRESWRRRVRSAPRRASAAAPRAMSHSRKHRCTQPQSALPALTHARSGPRRRARRAQEADTRVRRVLSQDSDSALIDRVR